MGFLIFFGPPCPIEKVENTLLISLLFFLIACCVVEYVLLVYLLVFRAFRKHKY